MKTEDLYAEARAIAAELTDAGLRRWADRIEDAIAGGSTGTEIVMRLRWTLLQLLGEGLDLGDSLQSRVLLSVNGLSALIDT